MNELAIILDSKSKLYLYEQIYGYIVNEIKNGKLLCNEKLSSTRFLAEYLQISRSTVELAYEQLCAEGYLEVRPYKGYYVTKIEELFSMDAKENSETIKIVSKEKEYKVDFSPNGIETKLFPQSVWRKLQKDALLENPENLFELGNAMGEMELRTAIAKYLHASRGVECGAEQIIVGAGNDYLLMLLGKILGEKQTIAMEEFTYKKAWQVLKGCGYPISPVRTDDSGIIVNELRQTEANVVYVMPSHQFPLGIVMPVGRRTELLVWANEQTNRYIIEDDYDSEFRYKGKPIPALQALDKNEKVIYIGTFSKTIAPAIRISYMVLPAKLLKKYKERAYFYASTVSRIEQKALSAFIKNGYFERHLNKLRKKYKIKHDTILIELQKLEKSFRVSGENTGLHILLHYSGTKNEEQLVESAKENGIKVYGLKEYGITAIEKSKGVKIILGFAGLSEGQIRESVTILKYIWGI